MKISYFTLFFSLLASLTVSNELTAQFYGFDPVASTGTVSSTSSVNSTTLPADIVVLGGSEMVENDYVQDELIVYFPLAIPKDERKNYEAQLNKLDNGLQLISFTKGGHYALLKLSTKIDACNFLGEGNPDLPASNGQGDQIGLNYNMSTMGWTSETGYIGTVNYWPGSFGYHPAKGCNGSGATTVTPEIGTSSVRVAIIDSGVNHHDSFGCAFSEDRISPQGEFLTPGEAPHLHGTYVANIISGMANHNEIESNVSIHSYEVLNENLRTTTFAVVAAFEDAVLNQSENFTNIISMSIGFIPISCGDSSTGGAGATGAEPVDGDILKYAIRQAKEAGIVVITSAGNDGADLAVEPQYPAAYTGAEKVVTVGALACGVAAPMDFSNYSNEHVDLFSTGANVKSFLEDNIELVHGSSFSTPIVAAKAAMHITNMVQYDPEGVICLLTDQSKDFDASHSNASTYGIVDATRTRGFDCAPSEFQPGNTISATKTTTTISPNPFDGPLTVRMPEATGKIASVITVYDGRGTVVLRRESRNVSETLNLSDLKPGVYWLNVQSEAGSSSKPIVKR